MGDAPTASEVCGEIIPAGFPDGVVNVIVGYRAKAGRALVTHKGINGMASIKILQKAIEDAAHFSDKTYVLRYPIEVNNRSPTIVFADSNLDDAVKKAHNGMFFNKGRRYSAGSRTFVESKIDGHQVKEILRHVERGKRDGALLVTGGTKWGDRGHYVLPTVLAGVDHSMAIAKEEIIGPVKKLIRFDSMEDLLKKSSVAQNAPPAAVITKDADNAKHIAKNTSSGSIWVNDNCRDKSGSVMDTNKYLGQRHSPETTRDVANLIGITSGSNSSRRKSF
ncbi:aldehyde dehydrogenase family protein [Teladorsagia circumcincta]|uniref:Aldehyde dehydrogenase family protein n=1 Tax=Teladorsagia circumcincta TaxID=45464 RepID=A0A2G9TWF9_TELCI|nr:aldehyde dehydrogenase family protein [Teladorsagia circumcincta]